MPASVCDALKEVFQQEGGMSPNDAEQMLAAMERSGQFQSETWSWLHDLNLHLVTVTTAGTVSRNMDLERADNFALNAK